MILSILIPTLPDRIEFLNGMFKNIHDQVNEIPDGWTKVQIVTDDRGREFTTGCKRNDLLRKGRGVYGWFVDDDDLLFPQAIARVLKAAEKNPDVIAINGIMTTDGVNEQGWEIRLGHPFEAVIRNGVEYYLRYPNHITPMKREHAMKVQFPNKTFFEDYEWATALKNLGVLKTQEIIEEPVYHYRVRSNK